MDESLFAQTFSTVVLDPRILPSMSVEQSMHLAVHGRGFGKGHNMEARKWLLGSTSVPTGWIVSGATLQEFDIDRDHDDSEL